MTIVSRPSSVPSLLGGSIEVPVHACGHEPAIEVSPWVGERGTSGSGGRRRRQDGAAAAQFASHGWRVTAVDVQQSVVDSINAGESHVGEEPGLAELVRAAHAGGRLSATTDGGAAAAAADVIVLIVPVMLDDEQQPDYRYMDAAVEAIGPGLHAGSVVIVETTLPVGDTRGRFAPRLEAISGPSPTPTSSSPSRPNGCTAARPPQPRDLSKLVGGIGPASTARAAAFYDAVLDTRDRGHVEREAAEFSKLADTTYRDVNIALANEFARYAERVGVDIHEVIAAANGQPYSHPPAGHRRRRALHPGLPALHAGPRAGARDGGPARRTNDGQVEMAIKAFQQELGGLAGVPILVLGLTYRHGVKELAYSRALPLIDRLTHQGPRSPPTIRC